MILILVVMTTPEEWLEIASEAANVKLWILKGLKPVLLTFKRQILVDLKKRREGGMNEAGTEGVRIPKYKRASRVCCPEAVVFLEEWNDEMYGDDSYQKWMSHVSQNHAFHTKTFRKNMSKTNTVSWVTKTGIKDNNFRQWFLTPCESVAVAVKCIHFIDNLKNCDIFFVSWRGSSV